MPQSAELPVESAPRSSLTGCGLALFLSSLSMLFLAGILGLIYLRAIASGPAASSAAGGVPRILWLSTLLLLLGSVTIDRARAAAHANRPGALRVYLVATAILALGFLVNQIPALIILLHHHFAMLHQLDLEAIATQPAATARADPRRYLLGLVFFLILLHALHVLGGVAALGFAIARAFAPGSRAAENPVRFTAVYWHFLGAVWLMLFISFLLT
jgi:heme/copper-type cytochrome/quinol oxidase subunit 3